MANEIKVFLRQVSASTSEAKMGNHQVLVDRPVSKGGSTLAQWEELFLTAIGGCLAGNLLAAIRARGAEISEVSAEVSGSIIDSPTRFSAVGICIT